MMLLQQMESAVFALLYLALGGYAAWIATPAAPQDWHDVGGGAAPPPVAAAPMPMPLPGPALPAGPPPPQAAAASSVPASTSPAVADVASSPQYPPELVEYFLELSLDVEYGVAAPLLRKWTRDIRIGVHGSPTGEDLRTLHQVVEELNRLVTGVDLRVTGRDSNIDIYFLPESSFATLEPLYVPVNLGFFRVWWDGSGAIYRARVLVASQGITQRERSHLIREELTQSLGLFNDSWMYPDSIFYQGWTDTTQYTELDAAAIRLLYNPRLQPGMTRGEVLEVISALEKAGCCLD